MGLIIQRDGEVQKTVTYRELKVAMDSEMSKAAESFVRIGYLFKMARDTDVLQGSGYATYLEFAEKEYNMDKSRVSRFINIHSKFADPEDPTKLCKQYQGFGYAKLVLMLDIPDTIIEELNPTFSKSEIQAVREELAAESKVSDLEIIAEQTETTKENGEQQELLQQVVDQILEGDLYMRIKIRQALKSNRKEALLQEILAPAGEAMHTVRIKGIGRLMLSIKGVDTGIALINVRSNSKDMYSWPDLLQTVEIYYAGHEADPEPEPEKKTPVAPVQPTEEPEKKKERKVSKVVKAKEPEKKKGKSKKEAQEKEASKLPTRKAAPEEPKEIQDAAADGNVESVEPAEGNRQQDTAPAEELQLECQMGIEQFPEYLPANYIKCHDGSEVEESETARIREEQRQHAENMCGPILSYLRQHSELIRKITITEEGITIE